MEVQIEVQTSAQKLRWIAVAAVGLSLFLSTLDATIVALALPLIASHFNLSDSLAATVTLSYAIPLTILVLPSGALMNRFRTLDTFLASILGFGLGSIVCGLAPSVPVLLTGRVVQGCFAALMSTQGIAMAAAVVSPKERGRAMGIVGTIAPLGGIAGPGIGGLLLASFGWSSIFFVNLPIIAIASVLGVYSMRGVTLAGYGKILSAYSQMFGLLRRPPFLAALFALFSSVSASVALYYLLPFDLSSIQQIDLAFSGLLLLCVPLGMVSMGIIGGYLTDRYHARPVILTGAGVLLFASLALSLVISSKTTELDLAWRLLLAGTGIGLFSGPNMTVLMSLGGRQMMSSASAVSNLTARLGTVLGPLAMSIIWTLVSGFTAQMIGGVLLVDGLAIAAFAFALFSPRETVQ